MGKRYKGTLKHPQAFPAAVNIQELREAIATLLVAELGAYKLPNNTTTPALFVLDTGGNVPSDWKATGLECIIRRSPTSRNTAGSTFDGTRFNKNWQLYLLQWDGPHTLEAAVSRIERYFSGVRSFSLGVGEQRGVKEQYSIRIPDIEDWDEHLT
uniref:hypothetical protein n=1 Tax=Trichocoleus desertorum TaxID=1481672 RepID=UPI0025B28B50|nr:hypothetical protein [Trichocoleus desertorum]